jgi:hypothetical protein
MFPPLTQVKIMVCSQNGESHNGEIEKKRFAILTFGLYFEKDNFAALGAQKRTFCFTYGILN